MKVTATQLRKIIIEEYIKEEGLVEVDQEEIEKLLRQIQGDKYRAPEEEPETLYSPGAEGRPQGGFRLEELKAMIREMLADPSNV